MLRLEFVSLSVNIETCYACMAHAVSYRLESMVALEQKGVRHESSSTVTECFSGLAGRASQDAGTTGAFAGRLVSLGKTRLFAAPAASQYFTSMIYGPD